MTSGQTILLIDDDMSIRKVTTARLERAGYRVVTAQEGEEGLKMARTEQPQAILLDIMMPRMDGREVLRRLKADPETRNIPVILLTVVGEDEALYAPLGQDRALFVLKPYNPRELLEKIHTVLLKRQEESDQANGS